MVISRVAYNILHEWALIFKFTNFNFTNDYSGPNTREISRMEDLPMKYKSLESFHLYGTYNNNPDVSIIPEAPSKQLGSIPASSNVSTIAVLPVGRK